MSIDFYGENIFRFFKDNSGGIIRKPEAKPDADILVDSPREKVSGVTLTENDEEIAVSTSKVRVSFDKRTSLFKLIRLSDNYVVAEAASPLEFSSRNVSIFLKERKDEYFYGGGVQNGRFSHKGKVIAIENTNNWTDGGVASPTPFYWSTAGYGLMWHTLDEIRIDAVCI